MTDDELERALAALPLEEPPADLHDRILSATILAPPTTVRWWEVWLLGTFLAVVVWLTFTAFTTTPDAGTRLTALFIDALRSGGLLSVWTYLWLAVGISSAWAISRLPFMLPAPRTVYNR